MKRKIAVGTTVVVVLLFLAWLVLGVGNNEEQDKQSVAAEKTGEESEVWKKIEEGCYNAPIWEMEEEIKQDDWSYHINEAEWTKKQGDWPYPGDCWYQCDQEGNVIDGTTICRVNVTIERYQESEEWEEEIYLNSNYLEIYDKTGKYISNYEPNSATDAKINRRDCFRKPMKKGESITVDLIFAVEDELKEKAEYALFSINNHGIHEEWLAPDQHCYIKLNIEELKDESIAKE